MTTTHTEAVAFNTTVIPVPSYDPYFENLTPEQLDAIGPVHGPETEPKVHFGTELDSTSQSTKGRVQLKLAALRTHVCIMGTTGSGKTGVEIGLAEEYIRNDIPIFVIDNKGDLMNLIIQKNPEMAEKIVYTVLTPGGFYGKPVNCFAGLNREDKIAPTLSMILNMIGVDPNPVTSKAHAFLSKVCSTLRKVNSEMDLGLKQLILACSHPPFTDMGAMALDDMFPARSRAALAAKLNTVLVAPTFEAWRSGDALDMDRLLAPRTDGKVNVTIYNVSHLSDDKDREFSLAIALTELRSWMRKQPGHKSVRAGVFIDECAGLLPPYPKNPPTKAPIMDMLKQGRAYGVSVILASQNPMDFDYKAMSNCQTWVVGRLQTANDRRRVVENIAQNSSHDRSLLESRVSRLLDRQFMLIRPRAYKDFISRDVSADLRGPLTGREVKELLEELAAPKKQDASGSSTWGV